MANFTNFGTGNIANVIGGVLAKGASATISGDVVVLAVPHPAVAEIQSSFPNSKVLKAFNANFAVTK